MEQLFDLLGSDSTIGMGVKFKTPIPKPHQVSRNRSSRVEEICLKFKIQLKCDQIQVDERHEPTLVTQYTSPKLPFVAYQLPVYIFNHGDKTLQDYLSWQLQAYEDIINIETVAHEIIKHWVKIKQDGNRCLFGKIFPLEITLQFWNSVAVETLEDMVPTSQIAVEKMLKRVETDHQAESCVICLEEMKDDTLLQMPCLHLFHEQCIKKWLNNSHYCPTCRFQMPTV